MFLIEEFTEARLNTVTPRSEHHGEDEKPAVTLGVEVTTSGAILDTIDKDLRGRAFKRNGTKPLPGMDDALTVLACNSIEYIAVAKKFEGWTLEVDTDIDDAKAMTFGGCKIDKLKVEPLQGGSVKLRMRIGTNDIDAASSGMLNMHVGQSIWIKVTPPKPGEGKPSPDTTGKQPDATDLFVAQNGEKAAGTPPPEKAPAKKTATKKPAREHAAAKGKAAAGKR
jgi:hypothetical protein